MGSVTHYLKSPAAPQDSNWHGCDLNFADHDVRTLRPEINVNTPAALRWVAMQTTAQEVGEGRIFDRANNLAPVDAQSGEDLHELQCSEIVDMLDWIVEKQRSQRCPAARKMNGQQERQAGGSALAAAKDKLRIEPIADLEAKESAYIAPDAIIDGAPIGVRTETLVQLVKQRTDLSETFVDYLCAHAFYASFDFTGCRCGALGLAHGVGKSVDFGTKLGDIGFDRGNAGYGLRRIQDMQGTFQIDQQIPFTADFPFEIIDVIDKPMVQAISVEELDMCFFLTPKSSLRLGVGADLFLGGIKIE